MPLEPDRTPDGDWGNAEPIEVFISYSHRDEVLHDELAKHLKPLEREGVIRPWHDRRITAGKELDLEIDRKLNDAGIVLLLVSPDFINSDYCWGREMKRAMERHNAGDVRVIPVILRPVDWHKTPFGKLLALPKDGKAVTKWDNSDEAYLDVARGVRAAVGDLNSARPSPEADLTLAVIRTGFTTDYLGVFASVDIANRGRDAAQVVQCTLEIPLLGMTVQHAPGPRNLFVGESWFQRAPFSLESRKLSRGALFFAAGTGPLRDGLPTEPLPSKLKIEIFLQRALEQHLDIFTLKSLRKMDQAALLAAPQVQAEATPGAVMGVERFRSPLLIIGFDYVPSKTPLQKEWVVAEDDKRGVRFSKPIDAPEEGCLQVEAVGRFAMDRIITDPKPQQCTRMEFTARIPRQCALYAGVWLRNEAGEILDSGRDGGIYWITYQAGDAVPRRDRRYPNEVDFPLSGTVHDNWERFLRTLPDDVSVAYPGLYYSSLHSIRLRGSLSVSPIWLI